MPDRVILLTTAQYFLFLHRHTGIFASFLPSKRISKIPLLIHFVSLFSRFICFPFVRVFPRAFVNALKGKVMICWDHLVESLP